MEGDQFSFDVLASRLCRFLVSAALFQSVLFSQGSQSCQGKRAISFFRPSEKGGCAGVLDSNLIRLNKTKSNVCMVIGDSIRNGKILCTSFNKGKKYKFDLHVGVLPRREVSRRRDQKGRDWWSL